MPRPSAKKGPSSVDIYLGQKIKSRRLMLAQSQDELAKHIGLTFQQIQKYERATNRITVSRLIDICAALKVPLDYFLNENLIQATHKESSVHAGLVDKEAFEIAYTYSQIKDPDIRKKILDLAKSLSKNAS
jgi:transcriptional regulator with XRE-family HTH domain